MDKRCLAIGFLITAMACRRDAGDTAKRVAAISPTHTNLPPGANAWRANELHLWTTSCDLANRETVDAIALTKRLPGRGSVGVACSTITAEGGLKNEPGRSKIALRLTALGLKPSLLVANTGPNGFDGPLAAKVLADPELRKKLVHAIALARVHDGFSGIELDLESLPNAARDDYTAFVREVVAASNGAPVSVDVHPKTVDDPGWEGPAAHDYKAIADTGATLVLMTYDLSIGPVPPGPSTKATWVRDVVAYARSLGIPSNKLMIGLPAYGYDFGPAGKAAALRHEEIVALQAKTKPAVVRDPLGVPHFTYAGEGGTHEVWFDDAESIGRLLRDLAPLAGDVRGVAIWGAGRADPALGVALETAGL